MTHYCKSCGLLNPKDSVCILLKRAVDPEKDFCSSFQSQNYICARCNKITLAPIINKDGAQILCQKCAGELGTCATCNNSNVCSFETSSSSTPKVIQQKVQTPMGEAINQTKNPARIEETCKKGCECYKEDYGCLKENNHCGNWTSNTYN
jgi:hypothetical protein